MTRSKACSNKPTPTGPRHRCPQTVRADRLPRRRCAGIFGQRRDELRLCRFRACRNTICADRHSSKSPAPLMNMKRRRRSTPTLTSRVATDRFGRLHFRPSIMSGCSNRDTAPTCSRCAAPPPSDHSKPALQISIACLIRFWMTHRRPIPTLSIFPGRWERCLISTRQRRAQPWRPPRVRICSAEASDAKSRRAPEASFPRCESAERSTDLAPRSSFRHAIDETCFRLHRIHSAGHQADERRDHDRGQRFNRSGHARLSCRARERGATVLRVPG